MSSSQANAGTTACHRHARYADPWSLAARVFPGALLPSCHSTASLLLLLSTAENANICPLEQAAGSHGSAKRRPTMLAKIG